LLFDKKKLNTGPLWQIPLKPPKIVLALIVKAFMIRFVIFFLIVLFTSCSNYGQLTFVAKLPHNISESSGLVQINNATIWTIEDHGNKDEIYQVDFEGKLLKELKVKNAKNEDWEDLAKDEDGNVYIADTGNNNSDRKDLVIYKIPNPDIEPGDKIDAEKIEFSYADQKDFSPKKEELLYDCEAIFYHDKFLYLITKNRSRPFNGEARVYKLPAQKGTYKAKFVGSFNTCDEPNTCVVTSADISPDGTKVVLLGYGKLWVFTDFTWDNFTKGKMQTIELGATTQLESVSFKPNSNTSLLLSDEERADTGQHIYSFELKQ
jgi:WD40 repeat protein